SLVPRPVAPFALSFLLLMTRRPPSSPLFPYTTLFRSGHTLRPHVLLLGGPNTFIKGMREAWQTNIPKMWAERGVEVPAGETPESCIKTPANAQYFAALVAIEFGKDEEASVGQYLGSQGLSHYITVGRLEEKASAGGKGLSNSADELEQFKRQYTPKKFTPATFHDGQQVRAFVGVDGGSTSTKGVLLSEDGEVIS